MQIPARQLGKLFGKLGDRKELLQRAAGRRSEPIHPHSGSPHPMTPSLLRPFFFSFSMNLTQRIATAPSVFPNYPLPSPLLARYLHETN